MARAKPGKGGPRPKAGTATTKANANAKASGASAAGALDPRLDAADRAFLASYDATRFERLSVAVDVCILTIVEDELAALVVPRTERPYQGLPSLPGVFLRPQETLEQAARRALHDKVGLEGIYLEQLYTFGDPPRDPRTRVVSVAYVALVPKERLTLVPGVAPPPHGLCRVRPLRDDAPAAGDRLTDRDGRAVELAFDHGRIVRTAAGRVRGKLAYTTIAFQLVPEHFTLTELQHAYEVILRRTLSKPAFRRKILEAGVVEETGDHRRGGHRPAMLYRFVRDELGGDL